MDAFQEQRDSRACRPCRAHDSRLLRRLVPMRPLVARVAPERRLRRPPSCAARRTRRAPRRESFARRRGSRRNRTRAPRRPSRRASAARLGSDGRSGSSARHRARPASDTRDALPSRPRCPQFRPVPASTRIYGASPFAVNAVSGPIATIAAPVDPGSTMRICLLTNQNLLADPFPAGDWPCDPRPFYPGRALGGGIPDEGDRGRARDTPRGATLRRLLQSLRRRRGPGHARHRRRAHARAARRAVYRSDVGVLRAFARGDEEGLPRRGHRHAGLCSGARPGRRRACRRGATVPALREALQQLFERRSLPALARRVTGRIAPPGGQDHAASRRGADRGIHRRHGSHGARR